MDERLKNRLVGAVVLVVAAVVFVPMLLNEGEEPPARAPRLLAPAEPPEASGVRVVPLEDTPPAPQAAPVAPPAPVAQNPDKPEKPAPSAAATPQSAPAPAASAGFAVQLASFSKVDNAESLRDKLNAKGYKAYVKSAGAVTRVYVGPQPSREEAERVLKKLLSDTKLKGIVVEQSG
jgi:DedD protein